MRDFKATLLWTIPWDDGEVTSIAFAGPGRIAAGNDQGTIYLFPLPEMAGEAPPAPSRRFDGHTNAVTRILALPDGRLLSSSYDHTLRLWNPSAEPSGSAEVVLEHKSAKKGPKPSPVPVGLLKPERALEGHAEWIRTLGLSADGKRFLSGDDQGTAILWDAAAAKEVQRFKVGGWLRAVALSPDAALAATCEFTPRYAQFPNANKIWDVGTGAVKHDLKEFKKGDRVTGMSAAAFSPDGKVLALGQGGEVDGSAKAWLLESESGKKIAELSGHQYGVTALLFSPDGKLLLSAGRDTVIRAWSVPDGKMLHEIGKARGGQFKDWIHAVALSPDGLRLAAADMAGLIQVYALA